MKEQTNWPKARSLYERYRNGDHISDEELDFGIEHFSDLSKKLWELGPAFRLQAVELMRVYQQFDGFKRWRERYGEIK